MKYFLYTLSIFLLFFSCKKYKDPSPIDAHLTNPYCNIPSAINYNWGFPGIPNDSVCIFPSDIFKGNYQFIDSFANNKSTLSGVDTFQLLLTQTDSTRFTITGFCSNLVLNATANRFFKFNFDSTQHILGQVFCNNKDTIAGFGTKLSINDSVIQFSYSVKRDTDIVFHTGKAIKQ